MVDDQYILYRIYVILKSCFLCHKANQPVGRQGGLKSFLLITVYLAQTSLWRDIRQIKNYEQKKSIICMGV